LRHRKLGVKGDREGISNKFDGSVQQILPNQFLESATLVATETGNGSDFVDERTNSGHAVEGLEAALGIVQKILDIANGENIYD